MNQVVSLSARNFCDFRGSAFDFGDADSAMAKSRIVLTTGSSAANRQNSGTESGTCGLWDAVFVFDQRLIPTPWLARHFLSMHRLNLIPVGVENKKL